MEVTRTCIPKYREVNNNKTRDKVTARDLWVPSKIMEVLRTRTYTSFLLKDKQ